MSSYPRGQAPAMNDDDEGDDDWSSSAEGRRESGTSATAAEAANDDIELAADGESQQQQQQQQQQQIRKRLHTNDNRGAFHRTGSSLNPVPEAGIGSFFTNIAELTKDVLDMRDASNKTDAETTSRELSLIHI